MRDNSIDQTTFDPSESILTSDSAVTRPHFGRRRQRADTNSRKFVDMMRLLVEREPSSSSEITIGEREDEDCENTEAGVVCSCEHVSNNANNGSTRKIHKRVPSGSANCNDGEIYSNAEYEPELTSNGEAETVPCVTIEQGINYKTSVTSERVPYVERERGSEYASNGESGQVSSIMDEPAPDNCASTVREPSSCDGLCGPSTSVNNERDPVSYASSQNSTNAAVAVAVAATSTATFPEQLQLILREACENSGHESSICDLCTGDLYSRDPDSAITCSTETALTNTQQMVLKVKSVLRDRARNSDPITGSAAIYERIASLFGQLPHEELERAARTAEEREEDNGNKEETMEEEVSYCSDTSSMKSEVSAFKPLDLNVSICHRPLRESRSSLDATVGQSSPLRRSPILDAAAANFTASRRLGRRPMEAYAPGHSGRSVDGSRSRGRPARTASLGDVDTASDANSGHSVNSAGSRCSHCNAFTSKRSSYDPKIDRNSNAATQTSIASQTRMDKSYGKHDACVCSLTIGSKGESSSDSFVCSSRCEYGTPATVAESASATSSYSSLRPSDSVSLDFNAVDNSGSTECFEIGEAEPTMPASSHANEVEFECDDCECCSQEAARAFIRVPGDLVEHSTDEISLDELRELENLPVKRENQLVI